MAQTTASSGGSDEGAVAAAPEDAWPLPVAWPPLAAWSQAPSGMADAAGPDAEAAGFGADVLGPVADATEPHAEPAESDADPRRSSQASMGAVLATGTLPGAGWDPEVTQPAGSDTTDLAGAGLLGDDAPTAGAVFDEDAPIGTVYATGTERGSWPVAPDAGLPSMTTLAAVGSAQAYDPSGSAVIRPRITRPELAGTPGHARADEPAPVSRSFVRVVLVLAILLAIGLLLGYIVAEMTAGDGPEGRSVSSRAAAVNDPWSSDVGWILGRADPRAG